MYTFGAIAPRSMQIAPKVAAPKLAVAPRTGMVAQARTITPAKTVAPKLAVAPLAPAAPTPVSPEAKPQQVQVVLVPPQEKAATPETKWYRSPQFVGGVASAVALGVLGLVIERMKKPKV